MNLDLALQFVESYRPDVSFTPEEAALRTLAAEVERLRALGNKLVCDKVELRERASKLEAENAELRAVVEAWEYTAKVAGMDEPPPEAAELEWFRRRDAWVRDRASRLDCELGQAWEDAATWEADNPKPAGGE